MDNIYTYLKWRGDLPFSLMPFNEIDSLILSLISYCNFDEIVPSEQSNEKITLKEASDKYWQLHECEANIKNPLFLEKIPFLLLEASKTVRFNNLQIGKYINSFDYEIQKQFAALVFYLETDSLYVSFRGTDSSIIGWKEDFNLGFMNVIPAQLEAVEYLCKINSDKIKSIRIGGQSKGGNLAIFASVKCPKQIQDKIISVHNFDGPGFTSDLINSAEYQNIKPRITEYVPKSSVIGIVLEHSGNRLVIQSTQRGGLKQHDPFFLGVKASTFSYVDSLDKSSEILDNIMKEWLLKLDEEQRKTFVDSLFDILENSDVVKTSDLIKMSNERIKLFIKSIGNMPTENKQSITSAFSTFVFESIKAIKSEIKAPNLSRIAPRYILKTTNNPIKNIKIGIPTPIRNVIVRK